MEKLVDNGKTRTIGLSNFNKTQIIEILSIPGIKHKPAVLQNESHPYLQEKDLRDFSDSQEQQQTNLFDHFSFPAVKIHFDLYLSIH